MFLREGPILTLYFSKIIIIIIIMIVCYITPQTIYWMPNASDIKWPARRGVKGVSFMSSGYLELSSQWT